MALISWAIVYFIAAFFLNLWPFNGGSDKLPLNEYETTQVNAYFYLPSGEQAYLGQFVGASACRLAAQNYAHSKNISKSNLSYVCCTIRKGSSCYDKIR